MLFAGESGTGKTMAARVLAADLGLELFSVDLATVVSKYVGETEQNLERIFAAAEGSNAILFFDEADALFGRRSEVSDSRDRYANIEVAYLLQRMEAHAGAVILATNLKQNIDDAFLRRLDFVVDFRFPEAADRRRIWGLVIPQEAPVAGDIDVDFLGDRFKLSGGSIRNCSLAAAFEAASAGQPLRMAHLVRAIAAEYGKLGRLTVESEFEPYFAMLRDPEAPATPEAVPEPGARAGAGRGAGPDRLADRGAVSELEQVEKLRRKRAAKARESPAREPTSRLQDLQQTRGNAAVGRHLQRGAIARAALRQSSHAFEFRIGGDVPAVLARAAKEPGGRAARARTAPASAAGRPRPGRRERRAADVPRRPARRRQRPQAQPHGHRAGRDRRLLAAVRSGRGCRRSSDPHGRRPGRRRRRASRRTRARRRRSGERARRRLPLRRLAPRSRERPTSL